MKEETIKKKIKEKELLIKSIDSNKQIEIEISGIMKKRISKIVDIPIYKKLFVSEYLFRDKKEKKEFTQKIINSFPKGSLINVQEVKE